jgi:hypothetical protein
MFTDQLKHRQVYDRYWELSQAYPKTFWYDWEQSPTPEKLYAWLESPEPTLPPNYVGDPEAEVLLVGDRGARPVGLTPDLPFFGTDNSSAYLTRALELSGLSQTGFALVNAWSHRRKALSTIDNRFKRVVALGNNASQMLKWQNVEHRKIPHPQYYRRFKHHKLEEYAKMLREAAYD